MQVVSLFRYPVKGLSAEPLAEVQLSAGLGFPYDRSYAVTDGSFNFDPDHPVPAPKTQFLMLAKYEKLARLASSFSANPDRLDIDDGGETHSFDLEAIESRERLAGYLASVAEAPLSGVPRVVNAPDHQFTDVSVHSVALMRSISLINLSTVDDLSSQVGTQLEPVRFRANLYFRGAPAWSELEWLGRRIRIGDVVMKIVRRTKRCAATSVNPLTALRDINVPIAIRDYQGHGDLGVYAEIETDGTISKGDAINFVEESALRDEPA